MGLLVEHVQVVPFLLFSIVVRVNDKLNPLKKARDAAVLVVLNLFAGFGDVSLEHEIGLDGQAALLLPLCVVSGGLRQRLLMPRTTLPVAVLIVLRIKAQGEVPGVSSKPRR